MQCSPGLREVPGKSRKKINNSRWLPKKEYMQPAKSLIARVQASVGFLAFRRESAKLGGNLKALAKLRKL
jgi:hypothetical protein